MKTKNHSISFIITTTLVSLFIGFTIVIFGITYKSFSKKMEESMHLQSQEISRQIVFNFENYLVTIIEASNLIQAEIDNLDVYANNDTAINYMDLIIQFKDEIYSIGLYDLSQELIVKNSQDRFNEFEDISESWFLEALDNQNAHHFSFFYKVGGDYQVIISKFVVFNKGLNYGVLRIDINFSRFVDLVSKSNLGKQGYISIINQNYNLVYTSRKQSQDHNENDINTFKTLILGSKGIEINNIPYIVNIDTLAHTNWQIGIFIDAQTFFQISENYLRSMIITCISFLIVAIISFLGVSKTIAYPLKVLVDHMKTIESDDYFHLQEIKISSNKEAEELSDGFNLMMQKIDSLLKKVVFEQNEKRKSELKALQNQINPHFLYNTLDSIIYMFETNQRKTGAKLVLSLSKLFRISISKGQSVILIKDEIEHAKSYLDIQQIRYKDAFFYDFIVDESLLEKKTLKLILQPLIENSIYHGLKNKIDKGFIQVSVYQDRKNIYFNVSDNGLGITEEKIDSIYKIIRSKDLHDGVGIKNIYQRLKVYFGESADLIIKSTLDQGTSITVKIPKEINYHKSSEKIK